MSIAGSRPDVVGCYVVGGQSTFYAARFDELERQAVHVARVLRTFAYDPGSVILTISMVQEIVQFVPFEKAVQILGMYGTNAEASVFDVGRVESIIRQFNPVAVCGVGSATLDGLKMLGHDAAKLFAGRTVWARADAYPTLKDLSGVDVRRLVVLGPALALECAHGGVHYDSRDWRIESKMGTLHLNSRMPRVEPIEDLDTQLRGSVSNGACSCGTREDCIEMHNV
jgi:hypothetical protein